MPSVRVIDYDHATPDGFRNAVLSAVDGGAVEAIWTEEAGGEVTTREEALPYAALAEMWDRIAGSLVRGGVFARHRVLNPARTVDAEAAHMVVAVVEQGRDLLSYTFAIPADEADPEFVSWMGLLLQPGGHRRPQPAG